jgi:uncharacterized protein
MPVVSSYHPVCFYLVTMVIALVLCPLHAYLSYKKKQQISLLLLNLSMPCAMALLLIFTSGNKSLIEDFWGRLILFRFSPMYILVILFLMPCVVLMATRLSLFFGYSRDQFSIAQDVSVMKGWSILGIAIPFLLAPLIEELGWRGYGVDSLRVHFNLFTTSVLFGILWAVWHLPLFFMKGYYHNKLWDLGVLYVINFFLSVFVLSFLINWIYYKTYRSIPAAIAFHSASNLSMMLLKTEHFTKCLVTVLLCLVSIVVIVWDHGFFFVQSFLSMVQE